MAFKLTLRVILFAVFVSAQQEQTVIQNKNVNIIVNLSPKDVAIELFKVLEGRLLGNFTRRSMSSRSTLKELENAVTPLISPGRRASGPSIHEVANDLDHITRRTLSRDFPLRDSLDEEILTRDIVADMMLVLKKIMREKIRSEMAMKLEENYNERFDSRRMQDSREDDDDVEDFDDAFTVSVKLRRKDIYRMVKAIHG